MLQSRVSTVEENCSFLEGQVGFLSVSTTMGFGIYLFKLGLLQAFSYSFLEFLRVFIDGTRAGRIPSLCFWGNYVMIGQKQL